MEQKLDITVINTVYFNNEKTINCFESLLANSGYPFKLVVVVNGADEELKQYLKRLQDRVPTKIVWNKRNEGCAHAENDGIAVADTEFMQVTHTDMTFEKDWLKKLVEGYLQIENPGYVFPCNGSGEGHINFHPLMKRELYLSCERDNRYKRQYSDFDWYWKFQKKYPNLCSTKIEGSIIYHECRGIRKTSFDRRLWDELEEADAVYYYDKWKIDAQSLYGTVIYKDSFLKEHVCKFEEKNVVNQADSYILPSGTYTHHFYQCKYCNKKIEDEEFKRQKNIVFVERKTDI